MHPNPSRTPRRRHVLALLLLPTLAPAQADNPQQPELPADLYAAVAARPLAPPVADGVPIDVVDAEGKPLDGMSVVVADHRAIPRQVRMAVGAALRAKYGRSNEKNYLALAALYGTRYVTDAKGRAMVLRARRGVAIVISGRAVSFTGYAAREGREPRPVQLEFTLPKGIDVLVVDHRGKPVAGVPVALVQRWGHGSRHKTLSQNSGRDGRLRLDHSGWSFGGGQEMYVEPWIPTRTPKGVRIDLKTYRNDPNKPIRLQLPQYGQVRVYVTDADDRPVQGVDQLFMTVEPRTGGHTTYQTGKIVGDHGTFDFVEVGVEVTVGCKFKGVVRPERVVTAGPRHFRELRVISLKGISAPMQVDLILLDADGKPVAREEVGVIFGGDRFLRARTVRTDAAGRLTTVVPDALESVDTGALTVVRRGPGRGLVYRGAVRIGIEQIQAKSDLGPLKLTEEPLLVAGTVVDVDGKPVKGVQISVPSSYKTGQYGSSSTSGSNKFFFHRITTGRDGVFEFRELGEDRGGVKFSISSGSNQRYYILSGDTADLGAKGHQVVVGRAAKIQGSFAGVPADVTYHGNVRLVAKGGEAPKNVSTRNQDGGKFTLDRCPPGTYRLEFRMPTQSEPFLVIDDVEVAAGETCKDPRLQGIDLSEHGKIVRIEVIGPDQLPVASVDVTQTRRDKRSSASQSFGTNNGKVALFVPKQGADVSVSTYDGRFRVASFKNLQTDKKIVLQHGFPVQLSVKNLPKLPADVTISVRAHCTKPKDGVHHHYIQTRFLDAKGKVGFNVGLIGQYRLSLYPKMQSEGQAQPFRRAPQNELRFDFTIDEERAKQARPVPTVVELTLEEGDVDLIKELIEAAEEKRKEQRARTSTRK